MILYESKSLEVIVMEKDYEVVLKYLEKSDQEHPIVMNIIIENQEVLEQTDIVIKYTSPDNNIFISRT